MRKENASAVRSRSFSVWFELRWGIIALMLTIGLITVIFYNHPSTTNATALFRTVPILPETNGRVAEIYVKGVSSSIKQGAPIFRLDSSTQQAGRGGCAPQDRRAQKPPWWLQRPTSRLPKEIFRKPGAPISRPWTNWKPSGIYRRNPGAVAVRDIERLQVTVQGRQGTIDAASAAKQQAEARLSTLLPPPRRPALKPLWPRRK